MLPQNKTVMINGAANGLLLDNFLAPRIVWDTTSSRSIKIHASSSGTQPNVSGLSGALTLQIVLHQVDVRRGMPSVECRDEFEKRYRSRFIDPAFKPLQRELDAIIAAAAWDGYSNSRKAPVTRKAGPGFADPDYRTRSHCGGGCHLRLTGAGDRRSWSVE